MNEFEIQPRVGVGPICLGMNRHEVHQLLGPPIRVDFDGFREQLVEGFFVHYDPDDRVEVLKVENSPLFHALFEGQPILKLTYPDALAHLRQFADFDGDDLTCISIELQMSLWRGIPQGRFETVTLGRAGYFT